MSNQGGARRAALRKANRRPKAPFVGFDKDTMCRLVNKGFRDVFPRTFGPGAYVKRVKHNKKLTAAQFRARHNPYVWDATAPSPWERAAQELRDFGATLGEKDVRWPVSFTKNKETSDVD